MIILVVGAVCTFFIFAAAPFTKRADRWRYIKVKLSVLGFIMLVLYLLSVN